MDEKEQAEIGAKWGEILGIHHHQDERRHSIPDTWELTTGWKTSLGLFRTICRMADEARGVDVEKLKAERDELAGFAEAIAKGQYAEGEELGMAINALAKAKGEMHHG